MNTFAGLPRCLKCGKLSPCISHPVMPELAERAAQTTGPTDGAALAQKHLDLITDALVDLGMDPDFIDALEADEEAHSVERTADQQQESICIECSRPVSAAPKCAHLHSWRPASSESRTDQQQERLACGHDRSNLVKGNVRRADEGDCAVCILHDDLAAAESRIAELDERQERPTSRDYPDNALTDDEFRAVTALRSSNDSRLRTGVEKLLSAACATDRVKADLRSSESRIAELERIVEGYKVAVGGRDKAIEDAYVRIAELEREWRFVPDNNGGHMLNVATGDKWYPESFMRSNLDRIRFSVRQVIEEMRKHHAAFDPGGPSFALRWADTLDEAIGGKK